jgi:hypothetical protein
MKEGFLKVFQVQESNHQSISRVRIKDWLICFKVLDSIHGFQFFRIWI